jgi:hypothetical protein
MQVLEQHAMNTLDCPHVTRVGRRRLCLPAIYPHYAGANLVLASGILSGIVLSSAGVLPAWAAFLVGAVPVFMLVATVHAFSHA